MAAYSQDLRQRVIDCLDRKEGSLRQIAQRFVVSLSFVVRLLQLHRRTGSLDPKPSAGGRPAALGPDDLERLKELVRQQPDATLKELRQRLGASCSLTAIWRALEKLRLSLQKKVPRAAAQDRPRPRRSGGSSVRNWPAWTRTGWSLSTRVQTIRRWTELTAVPPWESGSTAAPRGTGIR